VLDDNMYGKQALDTIVELVFNKPGEDIAVIMAGYEAPIMKMIRCVLHAIQVAHPDHCVHERSC
jgi:hypothetical protein